MQTQMGLLTPGKLHAAPFSSVSASRLNMPGRIALTHIAEHSTAPSRPVYIWTSSGLYMCVMQKHAQGFLAAVLIDAGQNYM